MGVAEDGNSGEVEIGGFLEDDDFKEAGGHAGDVGEVTGVVDRPGAADRRKENLKDVPTIAGQRKAQCREKLSVRPTHFTHYYEYDPRLSTNPMPKGDWMRMIKQLNPGAKIQ